MEAQVIEEAVDTSRTPLKTSLQTTSAPRLASRTRECLVELNQLITAKIQEDKNLQNWLKSGNGRKGRKKGGEPRANNLALAFYFDALWVMVHDFSSWTRLYGLGGAITIAIFGKKSVWKTQLEVLNSSKQLGGGPCGPGGDPTPPGGGGGGGGGPGDPGWPDNDYICDQAAQEFKNLVQVESTRISLSVRFSNCKFYERNINMEKGHYHCRHCYRRYNSP
jgi:hypothetical protein